MPRTNEPREATSRSDRPTPARRGPTHRRRAPAPPPLDPAKLELVLTLLLRIVSPLKPIPVQTADSIVFLRPEDVAVITSSENRRLVLHDLDGNTWTRFDTLAEFEKRLASDPRFFRSHKSFLVNLHAVRAMKRQGDGQAELSFRGKVRITAKVSEANMKPLQEKLGF